jgi:hypothetical protein
MKADLTRDTFHPMKHYARVVMQQGRVQLDVDWNEQASILLRYLQALAADLIGPAGGPKDHYGFEVLTIANSTTDFQIGFGRYYVNGLLCEADFIPIAISPATPNVFVVRNWNSDFEQTTVPFYEVFDDTLASTKTPVRVQIFNPRPDLNQITIQTISAGADFSNFDNPKLRRLITYLHQPDFVYSTKSGAVSPLPLPTGFSQIYLDVWERVITYAEDDRIREVALGGPDTAARTKLVWQVKWWQADVPEKTPQDCIGVADLNNQFQTANRGWLKARAKQISASKDPCIIPPDASYSGPENQLYRVEINRKGVAWDGVDATNHDAATFKWSRENGSVFYPIASGGGTKSVVVESLGRDDRFGLVAGNLVEVQDDRSVLMNLSGNLLPVLGIDPITMTVTLDGTPDAILGSDMSLHPLLRRWDQTKGDREEQGLTLADDNGAFVEEDRWLGIEDGVQILFQSAASATPTAAGDATPAVNQYRTSDYWLIPARTATGDVEWPKVLDAQGNPETDDSGLTIPIAVPPHGVNHYYAPLAVVSVDPPNVTVPHDCRKHFETVVELTPQENP